MDTGGTPLYHDSWVTQEAQIRSQGSNTETRIFAIMLPFYLRLMSTMERFLENTMYAARWLLAPVYLGLSLGLLALTIKFFQEIWHVLPNIFSVAESDLVLTLLSLVDMTLVGGLLVIVMFSGY